MIGGMKRSTVDRPGSLFNNWLSNELGKLMSKIFSAQEVKVKVHVLRSTMG